MAKEEIDIERLVRWAYQTQMVHRMSGGLRAANDYAYLTPQADSVLKVARRAYLGMRVDGGGPLNERVHPDAMRVSALIGCYAVDDQAAYLVRFHGTTGGRPDWGEGVFRYAPHRNKLGEVIHGWEDGKMCPIREINSLASIRADRLNWWRWHTTLTRIASAAEVEDFGLESYAIRGFAAPAEPWLDFHVSNDA